LREDLHKEGLKGANTKVAEVVVRNIQEYADTGNDKNPKPHSSENIEIKPNSSENSKHKEKFCSNFSEFLRKLILQIKFLIFLYYESLHDVPSSIFAYLKYFTYIFNFEFFSTGIVSVK